MGRNIQSYPLLTYLEAMDELAILLEQHKKTSSKLQEGELTIGERQYHTSLLKTINQKMRLLTGGETLQTIEGMVAEHRRFHPATIKH